ncbi:hypothetical protein [Paraburkholderia tropica]|uniref:hypothetical protein n=1 Tax=Paraburkholderia tropica TaxID=92647 RepID=UPI0007ED8482|nr:hypothetical protein [Paraburkholderia tropica]
MIDVYSIGTTLKLNDLVTPHLLRLSEQFAKVDAQALQVNKRLKSMGAEAVGVKNLASATGKLDAGLKGVRDQALLAERALGGIRGSIPSGLGIERELIESNRQVNILGRQLSALRGAGHNFMGAGGGGRGGNPPTPPLPPPNPGGGGRGHRGIHGGNLHVGPGGFGIGGIGMGLADGAMVPLAAGFAAAYVGHAFYEGAKDYQDEFMRFKSLNLGDQVNEEADKFVKATHTFGVSQSELMRAMAESVGLFGSFDEAAKFTPTLVTLGKANAAIFGDKLGDLDEEGLKNLQKFIDRRGGFKDEATFKRTLDLAEKLVTGSGGYLKFQDLGAFSQNAGTAFRSLSDEGLLHMEGLMIEQGGQKAGTALMSLYQNLVAGRTPKKTMGLLQDLGLATLEEQRHGSVGGKPIKSLVMTNIQGSDLLQSDPAKWMTDVLLPALEKKGITSEPQILKAVNDVLSNRNASNQGSIMTAQAFQVLRDYHLAKGAMGSGDVINMYKDSASGAEKDFAAAWADFKKQFGETMLPAITNMLKAGAAIMRAINNPMTAAQAQMDQVPQADHPVVGRWGKLGDLMGWNKGSPSAGNSVSGKSAAPSGDVHTTINIDGRKVAQAVTPYMAGQLGSGLYGSGIDNNAALPMPGLK